jgi:hypothetical protein
MKIFLMILLLLGVVTVEGKPKYRIQTWKYSGTTYYLPQKKVWARTNYFTLPFKVWESGSYPFQHKSQAEEIIKEWKRSVEEKNDYERSQYVYID